MKGYIYTMYKGADPAEGWQMTDPIYGKIPTLGACMPNIRKAVEKGDYIFSISGRVANIKQYVVGGFRVDEKIDSLAAYERFPQNRMTVDESGVFLGNIIFDEKGNHLDCDYHKNHENRVDNFVVGEDPIVIQGNEQVEKARKETLDFLNKLFGRHEDSIYKVVSRWRKLNEAQIKELLNWMKNIQKG